MAKIAQKNNRKWKYTVVGFLHYTQSDVILLEVRL